MSMLTRISFPLRKKRKKQKNKQKGAGISRALLLSMGSLRTGAHTGLAMARIADSLAIRTELSRMFRIQVTE